MSMQRLKRRAIETSMNVSFVLCVLCVFIFLICLCSTLLGRVAHGVRRACEERVSGESGRDMAGRAIDAASKYVRTADPLALGLVALFLAIVFFLIAASFWKWRHG